MNLFLDETRTARIEFDLPFLRELKVAPSIKTILLEEKPSNMGWGDFAVFCMVGFAFMARIIRFDIRGVIRLGVRLVGAVPDQGPGAGAVDRANPINPTLVGSPDESRKLLAKARQ